MKYSDQITQKDLDIIKKNAIDLYLIITDYLNSSKNKKNQKGKKK